MIKRKPNNPDWYVIPRSWSEAIPLPGVLIHQDTLSIHRTHLPLLKHREGVEEILRKKSIKISDPSFLTLRDYQREGISFANQRKGALLAFQMRMGKTPTSLASCDPSKGQIVVLGPLESRSVWLSWMRKFWPDLEPRFCEGRSSDPKVLNAPLVFCHYDILPYHVIRHKIYKLILDEVHLLSGHGQQKRAEAARIVSGYAENRIALTGTVLWNKIDGLWNILGLCDPGAWGSSFDFGHRYSNGIRDSYGWSFTGSQREDELRERLSEVMLAKNWGDANLDIPRIHKNLIVAESDTKSRFEMEKLLVEVAPQNLPTVALQAKMRNVFSLSKVPFVVDRIKEIGEEPIVVWVWYRSTANHLAKGLKKIGIPSWIATGEQGDIGKRILQIEDWQKHRSGVLIISIKVGQTAIDLSHARRAIFMELDWTPAMISQPEMRIFDLSREMWIDYVVGDHPCEKQLGSVLLQKNFVADKIGIKSLEEETKETFRRCFL